jgi:5-methylcytosine-specific restriction endonuclease McrA
MTTIKLIEPSSDEWKRWRIDADEGNRILASQFQKTGAFTVDENLYKRRKADYFALYHGKCVYCESPLRVDGWDQLDHFRPKKAVLGINRKPVEIGKLRHPGYYWLAYDWQNLVPSCAICNQQKGAIFPLLHGSRHALTPEDVGSELPVLIHPALETEKPETHFEYVPKTGALKLKTERARAIDEIVKLNREGLFDARRACYDAAIQLVKDYLDCIRESEDDRATRKARELESIAKGTYRYSFVARHALRACGERLKPFLLV